MDFEKIIEEAANRIKKLDKTIARREMWRKIFIYGGIIFIAAGAIVFSKQANDTLAPLFGLIGITSTVISFAISDDELRLRRAKAKADVDSYSALKQLNAADAYISNLGEVVLSQTGEYFQFVLGNVRRSTWLTSLLLMMGFALLIKGVLFINSPQDAQLTYVSAGAGLVLEFLSSAVFVFNRENVRLMNEYMKKLENFSRVLLALSLLDTTESTQDKTKMRELWFSRLINGISTDS